MQPTHRVILDTTVLSNFAVAGRFDLLSLSYQERACTGLGVIEEIRDGIEAGYDDLEVLMENLAAPYGTGWLPVEILVSEEEQLLYTRLRSSLGIGEAYCLSLAAGRGYTLGSDDLSARRLATAHGVRLTGTLGILVRLVREGRLALDEGNMILADMIARRYRSPVSRLDELVGG